MLSSLVMSQENTASLMTAHAKYLIETGKLYDYDKTIKNIEKITYQQVNDFIKNFDFSKFASAIVSNGITEEIFK